MKIIFFLLAGALVASALIAQTSSTPIPASPYVGRFQIVATSGEGVAHLYRIDTATGDTDRLATRDFTHEPTGKSYTVTGWSKVLPINSQLAQDLAEQQATEATMKR